MTSQEMHSKTPTPEVDALESEYHSKMSTRLRIWALARKLEIGRNTMRDERDSYSRECEALRKLVQEAREEFRHFSPQMDSWLRDADEALETR